jgi:hypothetical protein
MKWLERTSSFDFPCGHIARMDPVSATAVHTKPGAGYCEEKQRLAREITSPICLVLTLHRQQLGSIRMGANATDLKSDLRQALVRKGKTVQDLKDHTPRHGC